MLPFNRARHLYSVDGENSISCIKFPVLLMTLLLFDVSVHSKSVNSILQKFFSGSRSTVVSRNAEYDVMDVIEGFEGAGSADGIVNVKVN